MLDSNSYIFLRIVYIANIVVAGWIGLTSLFNPQKAIRTVLENTYQFSESLRITGALWLAICILSVFGVFKPINFSVVLVLQLIYKGSWLLVVAIPAILYNNPYPKGMTTFFFIWVLILPFIIPWKQLFSL